MEYEWIETKSNLFSLFLTDAPVISILVIFKDKNWELNHNCTGLGPLKLERIVCFIYSIKLFSGEAKLNNKRLCIP